MQLKLWVRQFNYEMNVLLKKPIWWVLPLVFGVWMYWTLVEGKPPVSEDLYYYLNEYHKIQHILSLCIPIILGILLIRRDVIQPTYEWMNALPVSRAIWWSAKWCVGMIYLSSFIIVPFSVYIVFSINDGLASDVLLRNLSLFIPKYGFSYALSLTIGMTLAVWIRNRIVYFIGLCGWMFGTYFIEVVLVEILDLYPLKLFHLTQIFTTGFYYHEIWGTAWTVEEFTRFILFACTFLLVLSVWGIVLLQRQQPGSRVIRWKTVLYGALLLLVVSAVPYGLLWNERLSMKEQFTKAWESHNKTAKSYPEGILMPEETRIQVTRQSDKALSLEASVTGKIMEDEQAVIPLTLDVPFQVKEVIVDGRSESFERDGQFVLVSREQGMWTKGQQTTITISYSLAGVVRTYYQGREMLTHSAVKDAMYFKETLAWYPIVDRDSIYDFDGAVARMSREDIVPYKQRMRVTLVGFEDESVYTSIPAVQVLDPLAVDKKVRQFESPSAYGVDLWSGPFIELSIPHTEVTLITTPSNRVEAARFVERVGLAMAFYKEWLPVHEHIDQILYMPADDLGGSSYWNAVSGNTYYIRQAKHSNLDDYQLSDVIASILFGDPNNTRHTFHYSHEKSLVMELRQMILEMNRMEVDSDMELPKAERHASVKKFTTAYAEGKSEQLKVMMRHYYETYNRLYVDINAVNYHFSQDGARPKGLYPVITEKSFNEHWNKVFANEQ